MWLVDMHLAQRSDPYALPHTRNVKSPTLVRSCSLFSGKSVSIAALFQPSDLMLMLSLPTLNTCFSSTWPYAWMEKHPSSRIQQLYVSNDWHEGGGQRHRVSTVSKHYKELYGLVVVAVFSPRIDLSFFVFSCELGYLLSVSICCIYPPVKEKIPSDWLFISFIILYTVYILTSSFITACFAP